MEAALHRRSGGTLFGLVVGVRTTHEGSKGTKKMICPTCGTNIQEGARFCSGCGRPVASATGDALHCASCGAEMAPGEKFCSSCGTPRLEGARAARRSASRADRPEPPTAQPLEYATGEPPRASQPTIPFPRQASAPPSTTAASAPAIPNPVVDFKGVAPRTVASLIDTALYLAFAWFVASKTGGTTATGFELTGLPAALSSVAFLAYFVLLEGYLGGTIGKLLLGMRVVSRRGTAPGPGAALIRNVLRLIDFLPAFYLLGIVLIATSREKQRFGDRIAGTFVVSRKGAAAMRSAGAAGIRGASGVPVLIGLVAILLGAAYLILAQPGPMAQMGGALGGLPMVGSLVTKQAAPTLSTQSQKPTVATSTTTPAPAAPTENGILGQGDLRGTWTGKMRWRATPWTASPRTGRNSSMPPSSRCSPGPTRCGW